MEKLILRFNLRSVFSRTTITRLVKNGYRKTGEKFDIQFLGSKGYISCIDITCVGNKSKDNRIDFNGLTDEKGNIADLIVEIYYSWTDGVHVNIPGEKEYRSNKKYAELPY